ncbi:MAG: C25 family cysteine peptidase [Bacteroides sp.]|nr:C25 family cysteine peptidase [Bacteroides sp.]MCM1447773.1 C25 family cysteine peptidase [Bacteroides sp.]MCM1515769.1 C25 family cysteine peptidase [Paraprevotella sp.]
MLKLKLVLFLFVLSQTVSAIQQTETFKLHFSESDYSYGYDEQGFLVITAEDPIASYSGSDEPGLPFVATNIAIPEGRRYLSYSTKCTKRLIKSNVKIAPGPATVATDGSAAAIPQGNTVYEEKVYPMSNCLYTTISCWKNVSMLHFLSCPFVYDAVEENLYFIDTIELTVTMDDQQVIAPKRPQSPSASFLRSIAINPEALDSTSNDIVTLSDGAERIDYVIITSSALKEPFERLLHWKKKKGLYACITTIEEINAKYPDGDCQLKIKKYLHDLYINHSLKYVLLGGDDTVVPSRGCYGCVTNVINADKGVKENKSIPTDLYYASFDGNFEWNANNNDVYGEINDSVSFTQSIYVSRVPVRTALETTAFVDKLLNYEQEPCWSDKILTCGVEIGWNKNTSDKRKKSDSEGRGDVIYTKAIQPYWNGTRTKFYDTYTDFVGGADYDLTPYTLMEALSQGYAFLQIATHGNPTAWKLEHDSLYTSMHGKMQTNTCSTIITTTACHTNAFDSSYVGYPDPCLSESFIRNPQSNVIAYMGSSRDGWESVKTPIGFALGASSKYDFNFYESLFSPTISDKNYGTIVAMAKTVMVPSCSRLGPERWLQFSLNPIGDPEMPVFTTTPLRFDRANVKHDGKVTTIDAGVDGCRICVMSENDNGISYYKVYENVRIISLLDIPVCCSICITKQGYIPYQYGICLIQNEILEGINRYSSDEVRIGSSLTSAKPTGPVIIKSGTTEIKASTVIIDAGTRIEKGAVFRVGK